jgi:hypothetical protein
MKIWHYSPTTGELFGTTTADAHPLVAGEWIVPANATPIAPPMAPAGEIAVFKVSWSTIADHRGETWWQADATNNLEPRIITALGDPTKLDPPLTNVEPPALVVPKLPVEATAHQLFTVLAQAMELPPEKIEALRELAKTL